MFVGFPIAHISFVCSSHGGGSLAQVCQVHARKVYESVGLPNSGQVTEEEPRDPTSMLASEHENIRMLRLACRLSQLRLYWTKHRVCRFSTSLLGTTVAICDARLARLVSRDDDAELPAAPLVHGIVTPWAQVGGRRRKWAVSTQHKHICGKTKLWDSTPSGVSLATADLLAIEQASNDKNSS